MSTPELPVEIPTLTTDEVRQIEAALAAARTGAGARASFDPATGSLVGARPVVDGATQLASVTAIQRHGGR